MRELRTTPVEALVAVPAIDVAQENYVVFNELLDVHHDCQRCTNGRTNAAL